MIAALLGLDATGWAVLTGLVALGVVAVLAASLTAGLIVGRVIRARDRQMPGLTPGTRVAYADLPPGDTGTTGGTVTEPTPDELEYGLTYDPPYRPEQGDVVVQWDGDERWDACWQRPSDVRALNQDQAR